MSAITTHVLDTALGEPAGGVPVLLERLPDDEAPYVAGRGVTDEDGRIRDLLPPGALKTGLYRLTFDTGAYLAAQELEYFFPQVSVVFRVDDVHRQYHVPLLLSPYGYATYRGS